MPGNLTFNNTDLEVGVSPYDSEDPDPRPVDVKPTEPREIGINPFESDGDIGVNPYDTVSASLALQSKGDTTPTYPQDILDVAVGLGLPPAIVNLNPEEFKERWRVAQSMEILKNHPRTTAFTARVDSADLLDVDTLMAIAAAEDASNESSQNLITRSFLNVLNTTNQITGNAVEFLGTVGGFQVDALESLLTNTVGDTAVGDTVLGGARLISEELKGVGKTVSEDLMREVDSHYTFDRLKDDISLENMTGLIAEEAPSFIPSLLALATGPGLPLRAGAFWTSITQSIAEGRVENDGRGDGGPPAPQDTAGGDTTPTTPILTGPKDPGRDDEVQPTDLLVAAPFALAMAVMERLQVKVITGDIPKIFGGGTADKAINAVYKVIAAGVTTAITEGGQAVLEHTGVHVGTEAGMEETNIIDTFLHNAFLGSFVGGAGRTASLGVDTVTTGIFNREVHKVAEKIVETAINQDRIDKVINAATEVQAKSGRDAVLNVISEFPV